MSIADLGRHCDVLFGQCLTDLGCLLLENDAVTSLGNSENKDEPDAAKDAHVRPEKVSPAFVHGEVAADNESERWTERGRHAVHGHWSTRHVPRPQIRDSSSSVGQRSRAKESLNQSANNHSADVRSQRKRNLEDNKPEPRDSVDRVATKVFGERCEKHWTDGETLVSKSAFMYAVCVHR